MDGKQEEQEESSVNEAQRLYLELFKRSRFNLLDGLKVVNDLLDKG